MARGAGGAHYGQTTMQKEAVPVLRRILAVAGALAALALIGLLVTLYGVWRQP